MDKPSIGSRVFGPDGPGEVTDHVAGHDIAVDCDNGTIALYCQDRTCREYEPVYPMSAANSATPITMTPIIKAELNRTEEKKYRRYLCKRWGMSMKKFFRLGLDRS